MADNKRDIERLRALAQKVAEIAALPIQQERIRLWKSMNALRPERPLVAVYPERAWKEFVPDDVLTSKDQQLRIWEHDLLLTLFQHEHIPDDRPLHNRILIQWAFQWGDEGVKTQTLHPSGDGPKAIAWKPPIRTMADCDKLRVPEITIKRGATMERYERACEIFDGILDVQIWGGQPWWSVGLSGLTSYRGMQQAMIDMYEEPEILHRIMSHLQAKQMHFMDMLERENALSLNNDVTRISYFQGSGHEAYTDELPASDFSGKARWKDMWGLGEMQEFSGISPEMFWEFSLQYQLPLVNRFGLVNYGCCEPLDGMYDMLIENIPNLRRLSVTSPYASKEVAAEKLKDNYIFSWKPNPMQLAMVDVHWDNVRKDIRETLDIAQNCCLELIMKSTETFASDPKRVTQWVQLVHEEIENHA